MNCTFRLFRKRVTHILSQCSCNQRKSRCRDDTNDSDTPRRTDGRGGELRRVTSPPEDCTGDTGAGDILSVFVLVFIAMDSSSPSSLGGLGFNGDKPCREKG
eukprot:gb/GECG01012480.1/.p1 GENE.gb/GECG01012480.1/~~gb/GECG01012480.1/.p1  ORF type:complete len:102 (+),score=2.24 gb/GECG01012480.1/:1-306(+)